MAEQLLSSRETAARIYAEILERTMFRHMLAELKRIVGEPAAAGLAFRIVRSSMREAVDEVLPRGLVEAGVDALLLCYKLFDPHGEEFEARIEGGSVVITKCPHYRFTKEDPVSCVACAATKVGALEALTGRKVAVILEDGTRYGPPDAEIVVRRLKHMPRGDPACVFTLEERGPGRAP